VSAHDDYVARLEALVAAELARRREAAKPKPRGWVTVGRDDPSPPPAPELTARGRYVERTVVEPGDPDRHIYSAEAERRLLYERGAAIDAPDDKPRPAPVQPGSPVIRVPRRTQVQTGAGEKPPRPTRWGLPPRDGQRTPPTNQPKDTP